LIALFALDKLRALANFSSIFYLSLKRENQNGGISLLLMYRDTHAKSIKLNDLSLTIG
jgi:hypothetical protein